ncbi:MerR family transcriptional regulator, partial [Pseudoalteromonas sp. 2103]|uniref:helix-turn-helix domain-containing protein n=2 Tax=Pseudoalteromonas TaxID=53246 RepID=UPI0015837166
MKVYSPSEIAELLDIKQATLRKYSIMLEEHGYKISRNSQNHRYYQDEDVITLRRVIDGKNSGVTLEEAIKN